LSEHLQGGVDLGLGPFGETVEENLDWPTALSRADIVDSPSGHTKKITNMLCLDNTKTRAAI
jgi:hypothetical protein